MQSVDLMNCNLPSPQGGATSTDSRPEVSHPQQVVPSIVTTLAALHLALAQVQEVTASAFNMLKQAMQSVEEVMALAGSSQTQVELGVWFNELNGKAQEEEKEEDVERKRNQNKMSSIMKLNVGGKHFDTSKSTLTQFNDSMLAALVSDRHRIGLDDEGRVFIDRSGHLFSHVLEFLRNPHQWNPPHELREQLRVEFEFFNLPIGGSRLHGKRDYTELGTGAPKLVITGSQGSVDRNWSVKTGAEVRPEGITTDKSGNLIISDRVNHQVKVYSPTGAPKFQFGSRGKEQGQFIDPGGVAVNSVGDIIVADSGNRRVQVFTSTGTFKYQFRLCGKDITGKTCHENCWLSFWGVAVDSQDNIIVSECASMTDPFSTWDGVMVFTSSGQFIHRIGRSWGDRPGYFKNARGVAVDSKDRILVADSGNNRVQVFQSDGSFLQEIFVRTPLTVVVDSDDNVLVGGADSGHPMLHVFTQSSNFIKSVCLKAATGLSIWQPFGIAVNSACSVYVCDQQNVHVW